MKGRESTMNIIHEKYDDFEKFIHDMSPIKSTSSKWKNCIFRGEASNKYKLIPTALRQDSVNKLPIPFVQETRLYGSEFRQVYSEFILLKKFYMYANNNGLKVPYSNMFSTTYLDDTGSDMMQILNLKEWILDDFIQLAALAQHYGVATRLLDWTQDFKVALYFASVSAMKKLDKKELPPDEEIVIWALDANWATANAIPINGPPLRLIIPSYSDNPNLNAQKGVLSLWKIKLKSNYPEGKLAIPCIQTDRTPLDELLQAIPMDINILHRITLPAKECKNIYKYVSNQGYDASRLFPGFDGIARKISEDDIAFGRFC